MSKYSKSLDRKYQEILTKWQDKGIDTRENLAKEIAEFHTYFAYHSGRIENNAITYNDTREIFEKGRTVGFVGDVRTLFEIQNLKECHERLLDAFQKHEPITEPFIREIQGILAKGTYDEVRWSRGERPGAYKQGDYVVGVHEVGSPAKCVKRDVNVLVKELNMATQENILTVASYFHLRLESIHPFADGNGRTGRALMNYLLMLYNHPPIIIYNEDKMSYYGAMEIWDSEADLEPMKEFLKAELIKTWANRLLV